MQLVKAYPPNIREIEAVFDLTGKKPVFTYGKVLFNPHDCTVDQFLMAHEVTHTAQQGAVGGPIEWWERYLSDKEFRLKQEVEAYYAQFSLLKSSRKDRNRIAWYLHQIARDLSSPMYGSMCTLQEALKYIQHGYNR